MYVLVYTYQLEKFFNTKDPTPHIYNKKKTYDPALLL
jgi:hypothetical protein